MTNVTRISLDKIHPNPHRNLKRNPIDKDQVAKLVESIKETDFWQNIQLRPFPGKRGHYQIAGGGHNRVEACRKAGIKYIEVPVVEFTDWQMYQAMVQENETQQSITPEIVVENIEAGLSILEPAIRKAKNLKEFNELVGLAVPRGTARCSQAASEFTKVKASLEAGEGLGRAWLEKILPGKRSKQSNVLQAVLDSHYKVVRQTAVKKRAAAKRKEAAAAKDRAEADRLEKEAAELEREAAAIPGVDKEILLTMPSPTVMREFARAVKTLKIPAKQHHRAAEHVRTYKISKHHVNRELKKWWFVASGEKNEQERLRRKRAFEKKLDTSLDKFVLKEVIPEAKALNKKLRSLQTFLYAIEGPNIRAQLSGALDSLAEVVEILQYEMVAGDEEAIDLPQERRLLTVN